ncbi:MAG: hypothetical protein DRR42_16430 [Gammaproteobacteria bacterium]|nr:MAG: hypothetical protein DRR42_16430 [Gammaproteobacteria bacterium]
MTTTANLAGALSGLAGRMVNQVAREDEPAKCREILKVEIDRARNQYAVTFEQLSQSFHDREDAGNSNRATVGLGRGDLARNHDCTMGNHIPNLVV